MTSTGINPVLEAVSRFQGLNYDDRLLVLASLYNRIGSALPANAANSLPTQSAANLVTRIQQMSPEEQLSTLRVLLPAERTDQNATMLDPNPAKALVELATGGGTQTPTHEYASMSAEARIAFWYLLAQKLGNGIIGIPNGVEPVQQATIVLTSLESLNTDELVSFLKEVV